MAKYFLLSRTNVCSSLSKLYASIDRDEIIITIFAEGFVRRWNFMGRSKTSKNTRAAAEGKIRESKISYENHEPENHFTYLRTMRS